MKQNFSMSKHSVDIASEFVDMVADEHISAVKVFGQLRAVYAQLQSSSESVESTSLKGSFSDSKSTSEFSESFCLISTSLFLTFLYLSHKKIHIKII